MKSHTAMHRLMLSLIYKTFENDLFKFDFAVLGPNMKTASFLSSELFMNTSVRSRLDCFSECALSDNLYLYYLPKSELYSVHTCILS